MSFPPNTPQYIDYHKIIQFMRSVQLASPRLQSFGHGDIVYFSQTLTGGTATYPYMFVTPLNISYDENITTYELNVIFGDIVNTDLSNEIDVVSDMSLEARNLLSQIWRGSLFNQIATVQLPSNATPFLERYNDHIGGVALTLLITVMEDMNACPMYDLPEPTATPNCETPTMTPSNTATPTVTPTNTATPTNTPSGTPVLSPTPTTTSTPTQTGTPTQTPTQTGTPTQTQTPTNTSTPTNTPTLTQTPTSSPVPAPLSFLVTTGQSIYEAFISSATTTLYTADIGNCGPCTSGGITCLPCITTNQVLYLDPSLTILAPNGFYTNEMSSGNYGTITVFGTKEVAGGFFGGAPSPPSPPSGSHPYTFTGYSVNGTYTTGCNANPLSGGTPITLYGDTECLDLNGYLYNVTSGTSTTNLFGSYYFSLPQAGPTCGGPGNIIFNLDKDGRVSRFYQGATIC
jgi:hypothetical protein